jgi:hypothetical protein
MLHLVMLFLCQQAYNTHHAFNQSTLPAGELSSLVLVLGGAMVSVVTVLATEADTSRMLLFPCELILTLLRPAF